MGSIEQAGPTKPEAVYQLKCSCNSYPWGKQGSESLAARLCANQPGWDGDGPQQNFEIDGSKSYAEMWMGTYPVLPSYIASTGEDLQDVLDRHPKELIGEYTMDKFGHSKLPFLPKVLSIAKGLPLQLHPDTDMASKLHKEQPDSFTDPNHKPEIALALSEFEAFCGFKPLKSIEKLIRLEPLYRFMPSDSGSEFTDQTLRAVVKSMLSADDDTIKESYNFLIRLSPDRYEDDAAYIPKLAPRLAKQYTESDPGILVALITMNYLILQPGEALYIPADGIHAYLSGDIIECMARSNNVLNTGLCPQSERSNVDTFCKCLTFTPHDKNEAMLPPKTYGKSGQGKTKIFAPPLSEFDMLETNLGPGEKETLAAIAGPSILLTTKGNATMKANGQQHELKEGLVFFVTHGVDLDIEAGNSGVLVHTAIVY